MAGVLLCPAPASDIRRHRRANFEVYVALEREELPYYCAPRAMLGAAGKPILRCIRELRESAWKREMAR